MLAVIHVFVGLFLALLFAVVGESFVEMYTRLKRYRRNAWRYVPHDAHHTCKRLR